MEDGRLGDIKFFTISVLTAVVKKNSIFWEITP
jgi:hypothetical protein